MKKLTWSLNDILKKLKFKKAYTCNVTSCPILSYYGICSLIGNYSNQCICPSHYEGDQCQYGIKLYLTHKVILKQIV